MTNLGPLPSEQHIVVPPPMMSFQGSTQRTWHWWHTHTPMSLTDRWQPAPTTARWARIALLTGMWLLTAASWIGFLYSLMLAWISVLAWYALFGGGLMLFFRWRRRRRYRRETVAALRHRELLEELHKEA